MDAEMWRMLAMILGPGGAAWIAVKVSLNGARSDIRDIKKDVRSIEKKVSHHGERITSLETTREEQR